MDCNRYSFNELVIGMEITTNVIMFETNCVLIAKAL